MKKPEELIELLAALETEVRSPSVLTDEEAHLIIFIGRGTLNLNAQEAALVLNDADSVTRFFEALGSLPSMAVEIHNIAIDEDVKAALEERFSTVDEL